MINLTKDNGSVIYTENALANIVGINVMSTPGVVGMAAKNAADGIWNLLQKENYSKGITITETENKISIGISIIVSYGTKFSEVANNIIQNVKFNIENLTELKVDSINVTIHGVKHIDKEN